MSRSLERYTARLTINVSHDLVTVPAGHKYEVVTVIFGADAAATTTHYFAFRTATDSFIIDQNTVPVGIYGQTLSYNAIVLYEGETLYDVPVGSAGHDAEISVMYVDVDYST